MLSESVWFEQVDTALVNFVTSKIVLTNDSGLMYAVPTTVRKPDEDFKVEQYPSITVYNTSSRFADERYDRESKILARDKFNNQGTLEEPALPYDLFYNIDFWAKTQTDMNEMTRQWLSKVKKYFNLTVRDMTGVLRDCFVLQRGDLTKGDFISGYERTFHSIIVYRISVELDERVQTTVPIVTEPINVEETVYVKDVDIIGRLE